MLRRSDSLPVTGNVQSPTLAQSFSQCHSHILAVLKHPPVLYRWCFPLYYTIASWGQRISTEVQSEILLTLSHLLMCVCSFRTNGSRWSTAGHAAAGGLGGFRFCPSSGSARSWAARCHAGQDGAKHYSHEAQQPTRAPTDAPIPNDG